MKKVPCLYCGVEILEDTARRTHGYCMPHADCGLSFSYKIGGEFELISQFTQEEVEKVLPDELIKVFEILKSLMITGDKLVSFKTRPFNYQEKFVKLGYAIYRSQKYFNGFVVEWENNPAYKEDVETEVSLEEIKEAFGEGWKEFKEAFEEDWKEFKEDYVGDWKEIEDEFIGNLKFTHCVTSPFSWDCLAGREYYFIKHKDETIAYKVVSMN